MVAVIVKKRLLLLLLLSLAGLILLFLGFNGGLYVETPSLKDVKVITPRNGNVSIEERGEANITENPKGKMGTNIEIAQAEDFFIDYRLERDRTRGQQVEWLREVMNNAGTVDETRQKAQEHLMAISSRMAKETELENLIRAKGFADAAIMLDENTATAIVSADNLNSMEVKSIIELISRSTGMEQQRIAVINKIR